MPACGRQVCATKYLKVRLLGFAQDRQACPLLARLILPSAVPALLGPFNCRCAPPRRRVHREHTGLGVLCASAVNSPTVKRGCCAAK